MAGRENICAAGYQGRYLGPSAGCWGKDPQNEHGGCFSRVMRIEERFAIKLLDGLPLEVACLLIYGGETVFSSIVGYVLSGTRCPWLSLEGWARPPYASPSCLADT